MYAVEMRGITKQFKNVLANSNVDLLVQRGEIHSLLGENGAGKSTLMNIRYGMYAPTSGEISVQGKPVKIENPLKAIELAIHRYDIGSCHFRHLTYARMSACYGSCNCHCNLLPGLADVFLYDAIVCTQDQHGFFRNIDLFLSGNCSDLSSQRLKTSKPVYRFGDRIPIMKYLLSYLFHRFWDGNLL